jgi:hypothetical protein
MSLFSTKYEQNLITFQYDHYKMQMQEIMGLQGGFRLLGIFWWPKLNIAS